jgi:hypothetical protein
MIIALDVNPLAYLKGTCLLLKDLKYTLLLLLLRKGWSEMV